MEYLPLQLKLRSMRSCGERKKRPPNQQLAKDEAVLSSKIAINAYPAMIVAKFNLRKKNAREREMRFLDSMGAYCTD